MFYQDYEFNMQESINGLFRNVHIHHASELSDTLFDDGAAIEDIEQEFIGNCFFLAALVSLIERKPGFIESVMSIDENYKTEVKFHDETITVDGYLPCVYFKNKLTPVSGNTHHELWVPLLNKAFCKYLYKHPGCSNGIAQSKCRKKRFCMDQPHYELINGGLPGWCWEALLGKPTSYLPTKPHLYDEIFRICSDRRYIVNACSFGNSDRVKTDGIVNGHAYSVIGTTIFNGERLIKLRNPWGKFEPTNRWTTILGEEQDDGIFWITFRELNKYFPRVFFCKVE